MTINATLINILHICHRELWLHAHAIRMEHTSDIVAEGKLLGETSYPQRADKNQELEISAEIFTDRGFVTCTAKIDFFDAIRGVVYETKKSAAKELVEPTFIPYETKADLELSKVNSATDSIPQDLIAAKTAEDIKVEDIDDVDSGDEEENKYKDFQITSNK
jgi:CRISPR/Cas system-associated exonuclease Cas4 (RecB family)